MNCRVPLAELFVALLLISGCNGGAAGQAAKVAECPTATHEQGKAGPATVRLLATLSKLNLTNPVADLDMDLSRGNRRFIGIAHHGCTEPGLADGDREISNRLRTDCLDGTSEVIEGDLQRAMTDAATDYAAKYNTELIRRMRTGEVT
jgi:hypothetical protein